MSSAVRDVFLLFYSLADGAAESSRPVPSFGTQPWHSCHKLIYVRPNLKTGVPVGHWPIPESFWPDQNSPSLVSREAVTTSRRHLFGVSLVHPNFLFPLSPRPCCFIRLSFSFFKLSVLFVCLRSGDSCGWRPSFLQGLSLCPVQLRERGISVAPWQNCKGQRSPWPHKTQ